MATTVFFFFVTMPIAKLVIRNGLVAVCLQLVISFIISLKSESLVLLGSHHSNSLTCFFFLNLLIVCPFLP